MHDPYLPLELERISFLHTLQIQVQEPTNLFLVAKRVRAWLLPTVFEVVIIHSGRFFPFRFADHDQFLEYGPHLRHLLILSKSWPEETQSVHWVSPPIQLESLLMLSKLTHLSIDIRYLFDWAASTTTRDYHTEEGPGIIALARHLPGLTHIAFHHWALHPILLKTILWNFT
ncbi:hypothetical protein BDN72DRAFT_848718 [Pluteus cervinus]|uniref:Uncharacterized protein n=1 Tax=Pluteus cervinus TaxID=181527 RepID=A0ACD3A987_9AGAR|nr:hypothetical protein BDN72DRAFT_848718 [Pluteus cervinus]